MTIPVSASRASALDTAGQSNAPIILWENLITAISSPTGVQTGGDAENAIDGNTFDYAWPTVSSNEVNLEFTSSGSLTSVAVGAHNLATVDSIVAVEYSDDGGTTWVDAGAGSVTPTDDQAIIFRFDPQTHADWRLNVTSIGPGLQPAIGALWACTEIIMEQEFYQGYTPPITPTNVTMTPRISEGGQFIGSAMVSSGSSATAEFTHMTDTLLRSTGWMAFQTYFNEGRPFFFAWRPTKYGDAFFAKATGTPITPTNSGPGARMSFSMKMAFYHDY